MAEEKVLIRCEPSDPRRCQGPSDTIGQCPFLAEENSKMCPRHNAKADKLASRAAANQYRLQQYQERMENFATNSEVKNLRAEIGILRMTLENVITGARTPTEFVAFSGKIGDLVMKVTTVIKTCQQMEIKMGLMLDRDKVLMIGQKIVDIVSKKVPNSEILDEIGEDIVKAIFSISESEQPIG